MKTKFYLLKKDLHPLVFFPKLLLLFSLSFAVTSISVYSQTPLSFTAIPYSDPDFNAPGRGAEQWHGGNEVNVPLASTNTARIDKYYRFSWNHFETTQGVYTWSTFDQQINSAINAGQKFGFGVMTCCPGCEMGWNVAYGGGSSAYPLYLHNLMQAESAKDFMTGDGDWIPNINSPSYLNRLEALNNAINAHIETTSYNGVRYKDIINYVDVRGYGAWGEWHSGGGIVDNDVSEYPTGTRPTVASLKRIVDIHTSAYPNYPLVAMIAAFDANYLGIIMNPPEIAQYILTARNNWGLIGWRRDSWGATDSYLSALLENNTRSFGGMRFDTAILNRYKYAPIVGEPPGWAVTYNEFEGQVRLYHVSSFGNGNYGGASPTTIGNNIRAASKAAGYRIALEGGSAPSAIATGTPFNITLNWKNVGIAPIYENWNTVYELKNASNTTVWSGTSTHKLKHFLPQAANTPRTDNFTLPGTVAAGTYKLVVSVKDPNNYRQPLPIAITGRNTDGSYTLINAVTVSPGGGPINTPPTARAGNDQSGTLPILVLMNLDGSASSDPDGSITSYQWTQISGPGVSILATPGLATTTVAGLSLAGDFLYKLTVTDNSGATDDDTVKITVNSLLPTNNAPVANAGTNQTITLPTNSATLNGSASTDADGTIQGYLWQQVSGPNTSAFSSTTSATPTVSGLVAGTYTYRLTVTDDDNATGTITVTVTVNAAANIPPVANAGNNQTITLPTNSATLNGTASTDADGTIAGYTWAQVSGPNTATFSSTTASIVTVSGQIAGTYTYRLTVRDNNNATNATTITVTVNAAANVSPVANAGANQTITLPTSTASLNGSASSDPDGTIAGYLWAQVSGPNTSALSSTTAQSITVSGLAVGVYTYRLTVTDNRAATNSTTVTVTVNAASNNSPVANAGSNQTITLPISSATLSGTASYDSDGVINSYLWQQVSGPNTSTLSSTTASSITVSGLIAGVYTYRLTVRDDDNATGTITVTVTVNAAANVAPVANAGANQTITLPVSSATLNGTGSTDADGTIAGYLWAQVSGPNTATFSSTTASSVTASGLVVGVYTFRLTVRDNSNTTGTTTVTVTVRAAANNSPIANAGSNQTISSPTSSVNLSGAGSYDPDGVIASYLWEQVSGPSTSTLSATNVSAITVNGLVAGVYTYRLTVTDNTGARGVATVTVTVTANFRNYSGAMVLYPNPATGPVNLVFKNLAAGAVTITIYDMNRRIVMPVSQITKPQGVFITTIDVSGLTSGSYILDARMGTNTKMVLKFVKR